MVATFLLLGCSGLARAAQCAGVTIKIANSFKSRGASYPIKVVDLDYWDNTEGHWRKHSVAKRTVAPNKSTVYSASLDHVGNEKGVVVRVHFQYLTAGNDWSEKLTEESDKFYCNKTKPDHVEITVQ